MVLPSDHMREGGNDLELGDFDPVNRRLHVERAYVRGRIDVAKSGKGRWSDLSDELFDELDALRSERLGNVVGLTAVEEAELEVKRAAFLKTPMFTDAAGGASTTTTSTGGFGGRFSSRRSSGTSGFMT